MNIISKHSRADSRPAPDLKRPPKTLFVVLLAMAVISAFIPGPVFAADLNLTATSEVDSNNPGSLRNTIEQCNATPGSHTIVVPPGTFTLSSGLGPLVIKSNVAIIGAGGNSDGDASQTVIQASDHADTATMRVFDINPLLDDTGYHVSLKALTIRHGNAGAGSSYGGAGIAADTGTSTVTIYNCLVENNTSSYEGAGLSISGPAGGVFQLENTTVRNNTAAGAGGGIYIEGDLHSAISVSSIQNNTSRFSQGGGINIQPASAAIGPVTISSSTITGNSAAGAGEGGGGIYLGAPATISGTTISGNTSDADGGGVYYANYLGTGLLTLKDNTTIENNSTVQPGKTEDLFILTGEYVNIQPPIVTASGGAAAFTIGGPPVAIDTGLTVDDIDNPTLAGATISVTGNFQAGQDLLAFTNTGAATMGNIAGSYQAETGVLTLTSAGATATLAQWQAALQTVTYSNNSASPNTVDRTIRIVVNDGTSDSAVATVTVKITPTSSGSGTVADPYQITTAAELNNVRYSLGACYILANDIDLSGFAGDWTPIAQLESTVFTGSLNGNGKTVTGLTINNTAFPYAGLFGNVGSGAVIKDLKLAGVSVVSVYGNACVGGLAGKNQGTVSGCSVAGSITAGEEGYRGNAGGLCGDNNGTITQCQSSAVVISHWGDAGGLVANNHGTVSRCYSTGSVSGTVSTGGLIGWSSGSGRAENCYSTAGASGTGEYFGGLIGSNDGAAVNCYATGAVTGQNGSRGGLAGRNTGAVTHCFYDSQTTGQSDDNKGTPLSTADMMKQAPYSDNGWDFTPDTGIWRMVEGGTYPILSWQPVSASEIDGMIASDLNALAIGYAAGDSADSVTASLTLPTAGANGTTVSWSSSDTSVVANDGTVTRPAGANTTVTLTATVSKTGGTSRIKTFTLTVKAVPVAPTITGPTALTLTEGYTATSTGVYTITGTEPITVTKTAGDEKITWNASAKKLDIAAGLTAGSYPVALKASNGAPPDATLTFTLTVIPPVDTYAVTYHANNGTGEAPAETNMAAGSTFAAADNTFTPPSGKKFKHWYTNPIGTGGTAYAQGATVTMPAGDLILYAMWEDETATVKQNCLEVTTLAGGVVRLNGESTPLAAVYSRQYPLGTAIRLEAVANAGYTFAYWLNVENASVIFTDPVYEGIMGSGINVIAVFSKNPTAEDTHFTVTFKDKSGKILLSTSVAKNGSVAPPSAPALFGYIFSQWSHSSSDVTSDLLITALYVREAAAYTVTVAGGTLSTGRNEGSYRFDMPVTVMADAAPDGQKFSHWEQDGKKVSTKNIFDFFAPMRDTMLTAVFVPDATDITNEPFITLSDAVMKDTSNGTIMFTAIKDVPAGYTPVECGVLLLKSATLAGDLTLATENVIPGKILDASADQFYIMKSNVAADDAWYARAYLIYTDNDGNTFTVYSDNIVSSTGGE